MPRSKFSRRRVEVTRPSTNRRVPLPVGEFWDGDERIRLAYVEITK